jgi:NADH-quinone oxidoreductase subunit N
LNFEAPKLGVDFLIASAPVIILAISSMIALLVGVYSQSKVALQGINLLALIAAIASVLYSLTQLGEISFLSGSYSFSSLSAFAQLMVLVIALVVSLLSQSTYIAKYFFRGEVVSIWLMTLLGMLCMIAADELISLFVGLEIASIGLYSLIGYIRPSRLSKEGAVKYLILGSFASAFLLFGFALLYAATGSMSIPTIVSRFSATSTALAWLEVGLLLVLVGLGFKLALAPFHMWAPDAYESSPTGLTAFMATAVKVMVIVVITRFVATSESQWSSVGVHFFVFAVVASSLIGNILALVQSSVKRLLAYSSVAHAGYMAMALCTLGGQHRDIAVASVIFYLVTYSFISIAVFSIIMWLEDDQQNNLQVEDLAGLAKDHPWAAFGLALSMFAFAGIPPTAGFMAKLFLFNTAILDGFYGLVIIAIIGAVISVYYYLRIIVKIYMHPKKSYINFSPKYSSVIVGIATFSLLMTLILGTILPGKGMHFAKMISYSSFTKTSH